MHFGTIYAVFLIGCLGIYAVLNLMSHKGIGLSCTASVIGYSLLPIVFLAALSIPVEMRGVAGAVCIPLAVLWCAHAASPGEEVQAQGTIAKSPGRLGFY